MRSATLCAAGAAAALALAGCGGEGEAQQASSGTATPPPAASATATATPTSQATVEAATNDSPGIASGEGSNDGYPFRFTLTELKRTGQTVEVAGRLENLADDEDAGIQVSNLFDDGQANPLKDVDDNESSFVFDGVALIDAAGGKKYLVARDENGHCVCSADLSSVFAYPNAPVTLQATLSAPPPDVTKVSVFVPNVKTFTDVPITD